MFLQLQYEEKEKDSNMDFDSSYLLVAGDEEIIYPNCKQSQNLIKTLKSSKQGKIIVNVLFNSEINIRYLNLSTCIAKKEHQKLMFGSRRSKSLTIIDCIE
jgi:hypothetical protein